MIEGLKIRVTSDELKAHCLGRAKYHTGRADLKESQLPDLQKAVETIKSPTLATNLPQMTKFSSNSYAGDPQDMVDNLEADVRNHRNKSLVFKFFAEHLFAEDYTLTEADLQRLEITKS